MKDAVLQFFIHAFAFGLLFAPSMPPAFAQSQALNGQIEGIISDETGAAVPNAVITAANIETGAARTVKTDDSGVYRFPLLPLGIYRITAEAADFKKFIREGVILAAGQTATIDIPLRTGEVSEIVTVSADSSIADTGKTDLSRVINNRDVQNLPIPQRNPYNLGRLQTNTNGRPLRGFNNANLNVNGYLQRTNYLFDGNWGNLADRPGVRLLFVSETYVNEVQIVTNGFSAEFGNTPGMIMNVVTPSGTNNLRGSVGFRFSRRLFYARPFFYQSPDDLPESDFNDFTATVGGAIIRDRWHFYGGFESYRKDENTLSEGVITIRPEHKTQLIAAGLSPSIFSTSNPLKTSRDFYIFRTDVQLNENNRLTGRFNHSPNLFYSNGIAALNTLERSQNSKNRDYSVGVQLVSYTPEVFNELRFQYVWRILKFERNELSGTAPAVNITSVANFGSLLDSYSINPLERATQIQDNLTLTRGTHVFKFGGGFIRIDNFKRLAISSIYTFPTIEDYIAARNGSNPHSYTRYEETFGNSEVSYKSTYWNFFAQDDWKLSRRLKINFGLRYDLYLIPKADENAPLAFSQKFNVDKNNLAPRLGIVYALREGNRPTIIRFGAGIYYETSWLTNYERALRNNGNPRFFSVTFMPSQDSCAPVFPNIFSGNLPSCAVFQRDIDAIAPDFVNLYAFHTNFQIEQAITENLSIAAGYVHSEGRHLPVTRQINCLPTGGTLADGRPFFGTPTSPCRDRIFSQFRNIQMVESVGNLRYDALGLQLTRRFSGGLQFSASYTFSKATDDAPDGRLESLNLSDASNRRLDRGFSTGDQRHTFVMSAVFRPEFNFENKTLRRIFNHNQFSVIANVNSGERFNIVSTLDLNRDGFFFDRPVGITRNAGKTPNQYNIDLRYSRFFNFSERYRLELFGEVQNLFNINSIVGYNNVTVPANPSTGELIGDLPNFKSRNQSIAQESRQFQLGLKFIF